MLWEGLISAFDKYVQNISLLKPTSQSAAYCKSLEHVFESNGAWIVLVKLICSGLPNLDYDTSVAATSSDQFVATLAEYCLFGIGVNIDATFVRDLFAPMCITLWQPCIFLAKTLARCDVMEP